MEESDVDEADCLGESIGEAKAVEGDDMSESTVVEVAVRRSAGFGREAVAVEEAMVEDWKCSSNNFGKVEGDFREWGLFII
jgi:hypothetical protein